MANREALRDLQTRLASRLQAARVEGTSVSSWLAVESAGNFYLLPLGQSGEIFPWGSVQAVPYTQGWFLGVANLRGGLVGVVDLAGLLGHPVERSQQALAETSLLVINPALQVNAALVVDRLLGLRSGDALQLASDAVPNGGTHGLGHVWRDDQGGQWQELNLQTLVQTPEFLRVSQ